MRDLGCSGGGFQRNIYTNIPMDYSVKGEGSRTRMEDVLEA